MANSKTKKEILNYDVTTVEPRLAYINSGTSESNNDYISIGFKPTNSKSKKDMKFITYYLTKDGGTEDNEFGYENIAYLMEAIARETKHQLVDHEDLVVELMNSGITPTMETLKYMFDTLAEESEEENWEYVEKDIKVKGNTFKQFNIYFKPRKDSVKAKAMRSIFLK